MAITATSLGATYDSAAAYTHSTTAVVPSGALVVAAVAFTRTGAAISVGLSGGGLSWMQDGLFSGSGGGLTGQIALFSADAPAGLASATTLTATGTVDFGMFIGAVYLTGVDTGTNRLSGTPPGQVIVSPASAAWTSTTEAVNDATCGLVGFAYGDTNPTSSAPTVPWAEQIDQYTATTQWDFTAVFQEIASTGSYQAQGTWQSTPAAYGAVMAAYKAEPTASVAWIKA